VPRLFWASPRHDERESRYFFFFFSPCIFLFCFSASIRMLSRSPWRAREPVLFPFFSSFSLCFRIFSPLLYIRMQQGVAERIVCICCTRLPSARAYQYQCSIYICCISAAYTSVSVQHVYICCTRLALISVATRAMLIVTYADVCCDVCWRMLTYLSASVATDISAQIRQHTSAYVTAYVSIRRYWEALLILFTLLTFSIRSYW
jgi:hypothetical protein